MTKQKRDEILKELSDARNYYARSCEKRMSQESGKIEGADYMMARFMEIIVDDKEGD